MTSRLPVSTESIERRICLIRGEKVMLDADLAVLYQVETKTLNRAVRRNLARFPDDFMFQLSKEELEILRCQIGTSSWGTPVPALCLHRAWCGDAVVGAE
jgi:ORF6N domain